MRIFPALVLILAAAAPLRAWNGPTHQIITLAVVGNAPVFKTPEGKAMAEVPAETLDELLFSWRRQGVQGWQGSGSAGDFIANLQLNPKGDWAAPGSFKPWAGDAGSPFPIAVKPGSPVPVDQIFETYVREPDWGMDQDICGRQPYPCNPEWKWMEAYADGLPSQAFRHMYWPKGYLKIAKGLPIPIYIHKPIGQAPERCQLYFQLSVLAADTGHLYWAARFLAWSMHYAQDVAQPFHAKQVPSQKLMVLSPWPIPNQTQTARKIAYYHLAFEDYMDGYAARLKGVIAQAPSLGQSGAEAATVAAANFGAAHAEAAADAALSFFPPITKSQLKESTPSEEIYQQNKAQDGLSSSPPPAFEGIAEQCMAEAGGATKNLLDLFERRAKIPAPAAAGSPWNKIRAVFSLSRFGLSFDGAAR